MVMYRDANVMTTMKIVMQVMRFDYIYNDKCNMNDSLYSANAMTVSGMIMFIPMSNGI